MASALSHEWRRACLLIGILQAFRHRLVSLLSYRLLDSLTTGGKGGWAGSGRCVTSVSSPPGR